VFLETKVWISDYGYDASVHALDKSARKLGVDRIDLLLLRSRAPCPRRADFGRLLAESSVVPAVNQIELHP
jgi:diketogulonate reductase-like aldo/keto reductase